MFRKKEEETPEPAAEVQVPEARQHTEKERPSFEAKKEFRHTGKNHGSG